MFYKCEIGVGLLKVVHKQKKNKKKVLRRRRRRKSSFTFNY